jgi:hypothetical protein
MQFGFEVVGHRKSHRGHPEVVVHHIAAHRERSLDRIDPLRRRCADDRRGTECEQCAAPLLIGRRPEGALVDLDDTTRVCEDELDHTWRGLADVAGLGVQRPPVVGARGPLGVGQERLAGVAEGDRFVVVERLDRRVLAVPASCPRAEQVGERGDVWVKGRRHPASVARDRPAPQRLEPTSTAESTGRFSRRSRW